MFAMHLDVNFWFRDWTKEQRTELFNGESVEYTSTITESAISQRKCCQSAKLGADKKAHRGVVIYDVFSFFNCSFENALIEHLGEYDELIKWGKQERGDFNDNDWFRGNVYNYCRAECLALVRLMDHISLSVDKLRLKIHQWYGPSAITTAILRRDKVREHLWNFHKHDTPTALWEAFHYSYFGGRVEAIRLGTMRDIFSYDLNSAFPACAAELPIMTRDYWQPTKKFIPDQQMSIYHVAWSLPDEAHIGLLPWRDRSGAIFYPRKGEGFYYFPEVEYFINNHPDCIKILGGFWHPSLPSKLSRLIPHLYKTRMQLKKRQDPAEYVLKIAMNAMYGKFFQRIGRQTYTCHPWAGWITSKSRRRLLEAIEGQHESIIAFAVDGIFSTERLRDIEIGEGLGQWQEFDWMKGLFIRSGVYDLAPYEPDYEHKTGRRGHKYIEWDLIIKMLNEFGKAWSTDQIFVTHNLAMNRPETWGEHYLQFANREQNIDPHSAQKRAYNFYQIRDWAQDSCDSDMFEIMSGGDIENPFLSFPYPETDEIPIEYEILWPEELP
jgi:hypothetical protein